MRGLFGFVAACVLVQLAFSETAAFASTPSRQTCSYVPKMHRDAIRFPIASVDELWDIVEPDGALYLCVSIRNEPWIHVATAIREAQGVYYFFRRPVYLEEGDGGAEWTEFPSDIDAYSEGPVQFFAKKNDSDEAPPTFGEFVEVQGITPSLFLKLSNCLPDTFGSLDKFDKAAKAIDNHSNFGTNLSALRTRLFGGDYHLFDNQWRLSIRRTPTHGPLRFLLEFVDQGTAWHVSFDFADDSLQLFEVYQFQ